MRDVAARVQGLADDLRGQKGILGTEWLGNAQQRFFIRDGFEHAPSCLETLVASLEEHAKRIEQIEVVIWVSEIVYATDPAYRPWE